MLKKIFLYFLFFSGGIEACDIAYEIYDDYDFRYKDYEKVQREYYRRIHEMGEEKNFLAGEMSLMHYYDTRTDFYRHLIQAPLVSSWKDIFAKNHIHGSPDESFATQSVRFLHDASQALMTRQSELPEILEQYKRDQESEHIDKALRGVSEASHKITAGAFGIATRRPSKKEFLDILSFFKDDIDRMMKDGEKLDDLLAYYPVSIDKAKSSIEISEARHRLSCRILLATLYFYVKTPSWKIKYFGREEKEAIEKLVGKEILKKFEGDMVSSTLKKKAIKDGLTSIGLDIVFGEKKKGKIDQDTSLTKEGQEKYAYYLKNKDQFYKDFIKDMNRFTTDVPVGGDLYSNRDYVLNTVNFIMAVNHPDVLKSIQVKARLWRDAPENSINLPNYDTTETDWENYNLYLDEDTLKDAIKKRPYPLKSLIWLSEVLSQTEIEDAHYNIKTIRTRIGAVWTMLLETLVHSYVFAGDHDLYSDYFQFAFPNEMHCTGSLGSQLQEWMRKKIKITTGDIDLGPKKQLEKEIKDFGQTLIDGDNVFIGSLTKDMITKWLIHRFIDQFPHLNINVKDVIEKPDFTLALFLDQAEKMANDFANEMEVYIKDAAKERAVREFNSREYNYLLEDNRFTYNTTDRDLIIEVILKDGKAGKEITPSDIVDLSVRKKTVSFDNGISLVDYLRKAYNDYIKQLAED